MLRDSSVIPGGQQDSESIFFRNFQISLFECPSILTDANAGRKFYVGFNLAINTSPH